MTSNFSNGEIETGRKLFAGDWEFIWAASSFESLPPMRLVATSQKLRLTLPLAWFEQHPLSESDLLQEQSPMTELGIKLDLSSS